MSNRMCRWLAMSAVLTAGVCTTIMNWRFSFQLGHNEIDAYVWATFSVALDICKWTMLSLAALTWRAHRLRAISAVTIWIVATVYSFAAALGFSAINRDATVGERRSQFELLATIQTMKQSPRWQSSAACADATTKSSKEFCAIYNANLSRLTGTPLHDDPQSALIARLTGLSEEQSRLLLGLSLALACELLSALGLFALLPASPLPAASKLNSTGNPKAGPNTAASPNLIQPKWRPRQAD